MNYPKTPVKAVTDVLSDIEVTDKYRWLEKDSPSVKAWVKAQNELTDKVISKSTRRRLAGELKRNFSFTSVDLPSKDGDYYFWTERKAGQDQAVLYVKIGLDGRRRVLIDPNKLSHKNNIVSLDYWEPSHDGRLMIYGLSHSGDEISNMVLMDVETGKDIELIADNASYASVAWLHNNSGFFYTKNPDPGSVPEGEERLHQRVYFHHLGDAPKKDKLIFGQGRHKEDSYDLDLSTDDSLLFIGSTRDWLQDQIYIYDVASAKAKSLITDIEAQFRPFALNDKLLLWTNYKATNGRVLYADISKLPDNLSGWKTFITESEHKLDGFFVTRDKIIASYLIDANYKAVIYDYSGRKIGPLPLPPQSSMIRYSTHRDHKEFFIEYLTFTTPGTSFRFNPEADDYEFYYQTKPVMDPDDYEIKQEWFESRDGTKVPMFIIHRKGLKLDGKNPTILYGYGGFESSITPWYLRSYEPWLRRGGIMAIANIRGGGEFGKRWHTEGIKKNKQKSYDDFIAAAEHLAATGHCDAKYLGILGGSNGGLLVSAVAIQRPELYRAVVSQVPLTDMVRFPDFLIAGRWISEYGDPKVKADLINILKFSPYHNVKEGVRYPSFLFTTADNDTRVHPLHARKMTALLQSLDSERPVLLYSEQASGHAGSLTMSRFFEDQARVLAFFAAELNLKI